MTISGQGGALPTCVPPLRRAPPPEGERMSFAQLSLLEPQAPMPRLRHVRRPFTPSREVGPYRLPRDIQDQLLSALASFRNRDAALALAVFIARFWSAPGRIEQAFPIDRRALANHLDLGLTEAKIRGATRTLERAGFLDRVEPDRGGRYQRTDTGDLHRKPVCFRLGLSYRASFEIANKRAQKRRERPRASTPTSKLPWNDGKRLPKGRGCSGQSNEIRNAAGRRVAATGKRYKNQRVRASERLCCCQTATEGWRRTASGTKE